MGHRILVVDDEPDIRLILTMSLERAGFEVVGSETGEEALSEVAGSVFDLVLLDLNLPGISGLETLQVWQADGVTPELPVLMLTADAREEHKEEALRLGCRDYLQKPITPAALVARIEHVLGQHPAKGQA